MTDTESRYWYHPVVKKLLRLLQWSGTFSVRGKVKSNWPKQQNRSAEGNSLPKPSLTYIDKSLHCFLQGECYYNRHEMSKVPFDVIKQRRLCLLWWARINPESRNVESRKGKASLWWRQDEGMLSRPGSTWSPLQYTALSQHTARHTRKQVLCSSSFLARAGHRHYLKRCLSQQGELPV